MGLSLPVTTALIFLCRPEKIAEHCRGWFKMNLLLEMCPWTIKADQVLCHIHTCCEQLWPGMLCPRLVAILLATLFKPCHVNAMLSPL